MLAAQLSAASVGDLCYCIGGVPSLDEALGFDVVVLDLDEAPEGLVRELVARGRVVVAYVNVGFAEEWRSYWSEAVGAGVVHGVSEYEGEYFVEYWSPWWRGLVLGMVDRALEKGFSGVYLDNIDAALAVVEGEFEWARDVDALGEMARLVELVSDKLGGRPVVANIGVATSLLYDGEFLGSLWGALREEVFTLLEGECNSMMRGPEGWEETLDTVGALLHAVEGGVRVSVVEFVDSEWEVLFLNLAWGLVGVDLVAQPSCDAGYGRPPLA